jgi:hypothetical protein
VPALVLGLAPLLGPTQATVVHADGTCTTTAGVVTCTYASTGAEQTFTVPPGVTSLTVTAVGAPGGSFLPDPPDGGRGAQVTGVLSSLTPGQTLYIEVGGAGGSSNGAGGFNGGGSSSIGKSGGGASDVRTTSRTAPDTLNSRLLVWLAVGAAQV